MQKFKSWLSKSDINCNEAYILSEIFSILLEGRNDAEVLRNKKQDKHKQLDLFSTKKPEIVDALSCPITPLSGYERHIKKIQDFAQSGPDQFAQVLMFSPLSANANFAVHWDNFYVLMIILKHYFPKTVKKEELEAVVDGFGDYLHSMGASIYGWKFDHIEYIWNNREKLMGEFNELNSKNDLHKIIARLSRIPGVQPVKAGFVAQLIYGKAGCIDTHNIDIYGKVFPELKDDLEPKKWTLKGGNEKGVENYTKLLDKLQDRGIGTKQLWDVWVDFVENFYKHITKHGKGYYGDYGSGLDPNDPIYQALKNVVIPKTGIGRNKKSVFVPLVSGKHGMGASATHLPMDADDALDQFDKMYRKGEKGSEAAGSVPFRTDKFGRPIDPTSGLSDMPSSLYYFGNAMNDPDRIRDVINKRLAAGGKKAVKFRIDKNQDKLFKK
jgi:hypothetical protein